MPCRTSIRSYWPEYHDSIAGPDRLPSAGRRAIPTGRAAAAYLQRSRLQGPNGLSAEAAAQCFVRRGGAVEADA
eukprot:4483239-Alexandrium_andersonii.AAC.1